MPTRYFSLLFLFIVFGCTKNKMEDVVARGIIVSDVVDIGQVRAKDSPAKSSFTITNHSTVSVEIDDIQSGCGCTVVELPSRIIRPNETMKVPVKIDVIGRKGDFNTDLLVRSTSGESWHIRIIGKVIEDIWYAGQSIRFHIDLNQEIVSKDFSISTIDYPNIQFEFETNDPDLRLSELSRSTQEGETRILFRLARHSVDMVRTSARIELIPTNVDLPKLEIPVYYHHLLGEKTQWLVTSQINLGEIKQNENITVKVYGDRTFLRNVYKVQAISKDDVITVVSYAIPVTDSDPLDIVLTIGKDKPSNQGLVRGSFTLFSHGNDESTIQVSGIMVSE